MFLKLIFVWAFLLGVSCQERVPTAKTPLGEVIGYYKKANGGRIYSAFEGIPYAKPPIGQMRFEPPQPAGKWIGYWNANSLTECAQYRDEIIRGDEDCLYINVYVPRDSIDSEGTLDVIVHIHGGAFMYLDGHLYTNPHYIMDKEVIFVTFNYRLGVLGFLSTEDNVVPGNNGLKDQVMALRWIRQNIKSFGGDPYSVTLTGLEAGAASVHLHYLSDMSRGLFDRGLSQNGVALNPTTIQEKPLMKTKRMAMAVGCPTNDIRNLVDCMKTRPMKYILTKVPSLFDYSFMPFTTFGPVIEKNSLEPFLAADPYELLKNGKVYDRPWVVSVSTHAGLFPVQYFENDFDNIDQNWENLAQDLLNYRITGTNSSKWKDIARKVREKYMHGAKFNNESRMQVIEMFTDRYYLVDIETAVKMQSNVITSPVYFYKFDYLGDKNTNKTVTHDAEVKYTFGYIAPPHNRSLTENELKMKDLIVNMLAAYAMTEYPKFGVDDWSIDWNATKGDQLTYLNVTGITKNENKMITLNAAQNNTKINFWKSLGFLEGEKLYSKKKEICFIC